MTWWGDEVLDRDGGSPLYEQLAGTFRHKIESGEWADGSQLPSERELCALFDVSRITVRHAISLAEREGMLHRVHGVGTFVAQRGVVQELAAVHSFERTLAERGLVASTAIQRVSVDLSDLALSSVLRLEANSPVVNLRLLGSGDAEPIVFYDSFFPQEVGEVMTAAAKRAEQDGRPFSTLDLHRECPRTAPNRLEQTFEAITADGELAELLAVERGWPILRVTSLLSRGAAPVEYRTASYRGDRYRFAVERDLPALV